MRKAVLSIAVVCGTALIVVLAAPPRPAPRRHNEHIAAWREWCNEFLRREFDFYPVNPEKVYYEPLNPEKSYYEHKQGRAWTQIPIERYIWIPQDVFSPHDEIPLHIETWCSPKRRDIVCEHGKIIEVSKPPFTRTFRRPPIYEAEILGPRLLIRRWPFSKRVRVVLKGYYEIRKRPLDVFFPSPDKIAHHWLHGTPVRYSKHYEDCVEVDLYPGDSFVQYVPNLLDYWYLKKDSRGRIHVKCEVPVLHTPEGYREVWLPIEGRYRVQYSRSNIIEFNIR